MLGRQQIAGIPTAISELFKNAHDAYADRVEIDYYRSDGLFVLRDDGVGMTEEEFIDRWLTIGTESKLEIAGLQPPRQDPTKERRPMLGEKGIGRLSIASIGPQVLVLTRAKRQGSLSELTAAFVNWSLFECPGVDIEDIQVPIRTFSGGQLPTADDVSEMVAEFANSHEWLTSKIGKDSYKRLRKELQTFNVDPQGIDAYLRQPSLRDGGSGVHFFIMPSSDLLPIDIDDELKGEKATPLTKALLGFTNTMTPHHATPVIATAFRDHKTDETADDLISEREFFSPEEFENADHQIMGRFDRFGQFEGNVSIYDENVADHVISWPGASGNPADCGAFTINLAAIEGAGRYSTLPPEEHAAMMQKMEKIGGLYIYRNGVRILPYGDTDYDWLNIEYHRTKSAYYYYFSHRKMFGVIEIDKEGNKYLTEKAGREGFRENKAYKQFKSILKNFFLQIAADFFRKEGLYNRRFDERKAQLGKMEMARRRRERFVSERKQKLSEDLKQFFDQLSSNKPQEELERLNDQVSKKLEQSLAISDPQQAAREIILMEQHTQAELREIEDRYKISRPRIALSRTIQRDWDDYALASSDLTERIFRPTRAAIAQLVGTEAEKARLNIDRRLRVEAALDELAKQARKTARESGTNVRKEADSVAEKVRGVASRCLAEVESEVRTVFRDFQSTDVSELTDEDFVTTRDSLESRIQLITEARFNILDSLLAQLRAIDLTGQTSAIDQLMAIEQRNLSLEEEAEADLQLAQIGMAVEIINHEFNATVRSIRLNLRKLKAWADINKGLDGLYHAIRASFDHLDGYLTLFTPLQRRLYRKAVDIVGSDIHQFLRDLFNERFARHNIQFGKSQAFSKMKIWGFPSSFYPVFVNLVDNAVYWLSQQHPSKERRIQLDAKNGAFLISDSGPGISKGDGEAIFEFGFSRKPGGRGMGLHISRETLRRADYSLVVGHEGDQGGATFIIQPVSNRDDEEDKEEDKSE